MEQMPLRELSTHLFIKMLKSGARKILENEDVINKLNIFPVSDHDTGTNIASLMRFVFAQEYTTQNFTELFTQIADASLIGASGNSGIIFSSFFSGLTQPPLSLTDKLTLTDFTTCMHYAVLNAYQAVSEPIEGTILTVMKAWEVSLEAISEQTEDYRLVITHGLQKTEEALYQTEYQLPLLTENKVVDAGGFAFVLLLQGMSEAIHNADDEEVKQQEESFNSHISLPSVMHDFQSNFQYCFESTLLTQADITQIAAELEKQGDSLVTTKSPSYTKIHLHTNNPITATRIIQKLGPIRYQKIDNIFQQYDVTHHRKFPIALVTDSTADLPMQFIIDNQIHIIPILIKMGENTYLDRISTNLEMLYEAINKQELKATTSVPSPESIARSLNFLADHFESIICITISEKLSGFNQLLLQQAKKLSGKQISVINSKSFSVGQGMLVMKTAELIKQHLSHQVIVQRIEHLVENTYAYAAINNFKAIVQSGRAPQMVGSIANLLHFKPIISVDHVGKTMLAAAAVGNKMSDKKLLRLLKTRLDEISPTSIAIAHAQALPKAELIAESIFKSFGVTPLYIHETSASLGLHAGEGSIAVGVLGAQLSYDSSQISIG